MIDDGDPNPCPNSDEKNQEKDFLNQMRITSAENQHHHDHLIINGIELGLTLGLSSPPPPPPFYNFPIPPFLPAATAPAGPSSSRKQRKKISRPRQAGKSDTVPPPYPWATNERATVHDLDYLLSHNLSKIGGTVQCKRCEKQFEIEYDLHEKFNKVYNFILSNKVSMHQRAPEVWMNPVLLPCRFCKQDNSAKPVIAEKKKGINWLFLVLGQMLGCCTLDQLKYFCKHTNNHRTGAKDRILYLTYLALCNQLYPDMIPF